MAAGDRAGALQFAGVHSTAGPPAPRGRARPRDRDLDRPAPDRRDPGAGRRPRRRRRDPRRVRRRRRPGGRRPRARRDQARVRRALSGGRPHRREHAAADLRRPRPARHPPGRAARAEPAARRPGRWMPGARGARAGCGAARPADRAGARRRRASRDGSTSPRRRSEGTVAARPARARAPASRDEARRIALELLDALVYAHGHDVRHGDLRPKHVLLARNGVTVASFGLVEALDVAAAGSAGSTAVTIGAPAYLSPEQLAGESTADERSDLYSLGCIVFEMLAGEPPFGGSNLSAVLSRKLTQSAPQVSSLRESVPPAARRASWPAAWPGFPPTGSSAPPRRGRRSRRRNDRRAAVRARRRAGRTLPDRAGDRPRRGRDGLPGPGPPARAPGGAQGAQLGAGRRRSASSASSGRSAPRPACSILTSCRCSIPAAPPAGSSAPCPTSRADRFATGSGARVPCRSRPPPSSPPRSPPR